MELFSLILIELDEYLIQQILENLTDEKIYQLYFFLDKKSLFHFIHLLPDEKKSKLITSLSKKEKENFKTIENYKENTAASIMDITYISVHKSKKVIELLEKSRNFLQKSDYLNYIFVIGNRSELIGIVSLRDLLLASPNEEIEKIYKTTISVNIQTSLHDLIVLVKKYNLDILPVISKNGKILGQITSQYLIKFIEEENIENVKKFAGITNDFDLRELSVLRHSFSRLPWLFMAIVGGNLTAAVISLFKGMLMDKIAIYFFLPTIMSISSIIGIQTILLIVQSYQFQNFHFKKFLFQEIKITLVNSLICCTIFFLMTIFWNPLDVSLFIMGAIFIGGIMASFIGISIFSLFYRLNIDVGIALGPFFTILNDFSILLIYFLLANLFFSIIL